VAPDFCDHGFVLAFDFSLPYDAVGAALCLAAAASRPVSGEARADFEFERPVVYNRISSIQFLEISLARSDGGAVA
jgi:hypothetical protein